MNKEEIENWQRIKDHFETLSEEARESMFYKRACIIVAKGVDVAPGGGLPDVGKSL